MPQVHAATEKQVIVVVATDGTGDVKTVSEAIARVPENNKQAYLIRVVAQSKERASSLL